MTFCSCLNKTEEQQQLRNMCQGIATLLQMAITPILWSYRKFSPEDTAMPDTIRIFNCLNDMRPTSITMTIGKTSSPRKSSASSTIHDVGPGSRSCCWKGLFSWRWTYDPVLSSHDLLQSILILLLVRSTENVMSWRFVEAEDALAPYRGWPFCGWSPFRGSPVLDITSRSKKQKHPRSTLPPG